MGDGPEQAGRKSTERSTIMKKYYFTIAGTKYYHGSEFLKKNTRVKLVKEPGNAHDREAIRVEMKGLGLIGYVANSPYTVIGESCSAGRIYGKFGKKAKGTVLYVLPKGVLCYIEV